MRRSPTTYFYCDLQRSVQPVAATLRCPMPRSAMLIRSSTSSCSIRAGSDRMCSRPSSYSCTRCGPLRLMLWLHNGDNQVLACERPGERARAYARWRRSIHSTPNSGLRPQTVFQTMEPPYPENTAVFRAPQTQKSTCAVILFSWNGAASRSLTSPCVPRCVPAPRGRIAFKSIPLFVKFYGEHSIDLGSFGRLDGRRALPSTTAFPRAASPRLRYRTAGAGGDSFSSLRRLRIDSLSRLELTSLLPRLAAICSRFAATVRYTNAAVRFANPRFVPFDAPCVLAAIACVVDRDHIAGQVAVHVDGLDGSDACAAGTIKFWHVNSPGERERLTLVA